MDNQNRGSKNEWEKWNAASLCPGGNEAEKQMQSVGVNVKKWDRPHLLNFLRSLLEELSILEKAFGHATLEFLILPSAVRKELHTVLLFWLPYFIDI